MFSEGKIFKNIFYKEEQCFYKEQRKTKVNGVNSSPKRAMNSKITKCQQKRNHTDKCRDLPMDNLVIVS